MKKSLMLAAALCTAILVVGEARAKPLKVYILAGQSNMEGHAKVETFDYIGDDPATAPLLKEMRGADGKPRVCDKVWISYLTGSRENAGEGFGKLTAGYGARKNPTEDGGKIGPEFTFGITMSKAIDGPILIIKTAWGGKSLNTDFRPPSAGPYKFSDAQLENLKKRGKDIKQAKADKAARTGHYYRLMIKHVKHVLGDIKRVVPNYDAKQGYEIAGFAWFQGWNDMVDSGTYPNRGKPGVGYAMYGKWMAQFIRDVRKDLNAPKMPFVIGVMGVGGPIEKYSNPRYKVTHGNFRAAMAAPTKLPEFKGNVLAVRTGLYWDKPLETIADKFGKVKKMGHYLRNKSKGQPNEDGKMTPKQQREYLKEYRAKVVTAKDEATWKRGASNAGYHYLGCAKTMALIGKAFAEAIGKMEKK
ncbi:MAG: sialate O-acetylesterase [Phycisphaerae bacterium]|jgi:alpha-galactosidase|nr:sialate O-acetylesterase [Phycisphaerae bacterium]